MPGEQEVLVLAGTTLLAAAKKAGLGLGSSCRGEAACGWCRVQILAGAEALSPMAPEERALLTKIAARPDERLACQAEAWGPVSLTTSYW